MTDSAREVRLLELAREAAKDAHYEFLEVGHHPDFATCRHFDCRLVREAATPPNENQLTNLAGSRRPPAGGRAAPPCGASWWRFGGGSCDNRGVRNARTFTKW